MKRFSLLLTLLFGCSVLFSQSNSNPFHDTQGNIEVNGSGQLQFSLPIALPPGIKSVAPQINLMYTSGSNNGIAGYGWNLSGITSISRVGKNLDKDGKAEGIQLNYEDIYRFNGQRLILKSGEYGKDGAEYVTEKYSNIKIKSIGALSGKNWLGPEFWEVTFEDGSQTWYGVEASAKTPVEYNITKWKDAQGNYISYEYVQKNHVAMIQRILWGGNEALNKPHFNEMVFTYGERDLKEFSYVMGERLIQDKILMSIQVNSNGKQFKKYVINYDNGSNGTKYQFVKNITEYNSKNEPANPVTFEHSDSKENAGIMYQNSNFDDIYGNNVFMGDFDGDGKIDIIKGYTLSLGRFENKNIINVKYEGYIIGTGIGVNKGNIVENGQFLFTGKVENDIVSIYSYKLEKDYFKLIDIYRYDISSYKFKDGPQYQYDSIYDYGINFELTNTRESYRSIGIGKEGDFNGDGISDFCIEIVNNQIYFYRDDIEDTEKSFKVSNKLFYLDIKNNSFKELNIVENNLNYEIIDFNGDGRTDLLNTSNNRIKVYSYNDKLEDFEEIINISATFSTDKIILGDFNGDGKTDIFSPVMYGGSDWNMYVSTGKGYTKFYYSNLSKYEPSWQGAPRKRRNIQRTYAAPDLNKDGKSDFIIFESQRWYKDGVFDWNDPDSSYGFHYFRNDGVEASGKPIFSLAYHIAPEEKRCGTCETINYSGYGEHYIPIFGNFRIAQLNTDFIILHKTKLITWNMGGNIPKISRIKSITQGGVKTDIGYTPLLEGNVYQWDKNSSLVYPYVNIKENVNHFVVSKVIQDKKQQDFRYRGLVSHFKGKGMIGFRKTARSSWYADGFEKTKVWSGVEIDPMNESLPIKEWSIKTDNESEIFPTDLSFNNQRLLSLKTTNYKIDELLDGAKVTASNLSDKSRIVMAIVPTEVQSKDFLKEVTTIDQIKYDKYYLPRKTISSTNRGFVEKITTLSYYPPNLTGEGKDYNIGRPRSKEELVKAYGDSKGAKEEYEYENHLLKKLKTYNRDNTGYLEENYEYDGFGNILSKIISNSLDSHTQTASSRYDDKGRFVVEKSDALGLITRITYNDWGQVLTQTDPFGVTLTNTYDAWGKLLRSKTNLSGITSYTYEKLSNGDAKVTEYTPDGGESITYTNKIGQNYKSTTKVFGEEKYVSKSTEYDALGRKVRESEPYFEGQGASQWNTIEYDKYSRPVKATAFTGKIVETAYTKNTVTTTETNANGRFKKQTFDAIGNVISTEDKGGTIFFKYNAAGEQIEAKYGTNIVTTSYDAWGRKIEFFDPSNGRYRYEYNHGLGLLTKTISPKGEKSYIYNNKAQLISQKEASTDGSDTTNKIIQFTYNDKGQILSKQGTSKGKSFLSNIRYDDYGRVLSVVENSYGKTYEKKNIVYDAMSRAVSYEKSLSSEGKTTNVTIEQVYDSRTGELYQLKDKKSGKILWELKEQNAKGQLTKALLGGTKISNTYDSNGFLSFVRHEVENKPDLLSLFYSFNAIKNELTGRSRGGTMNILESFEYDENNRLVKWTNPVTTENHYNLYDKEGRIIENDELGRIKFENSGKVYQPTGVTLNSKGEELLKNNLIQTIRYNENNDPIFIEGERGDVSFEYGLNSMRQKVSFGGKIEEQNHSEGRYTRYYSEDGSFEVTRDNQTGKEKHILYIGGNPYESEIIFAKDYAESEGKYLFLHKDYLGSILAISDEEGNSIEQRHYDAWGNMTHLQIGNGAVLTGEELERAKAQMFLDRGYTSHEHFWEVGIIHMNGRLYDPLLRRFLNADENIQDPHNTQNYNKYGYVFNNPLIYNDPSGEFFFAALAPILGKVLAGIITGAVVGATIGAGSYLLNATITGNFSLKDFGRSILMGAVTGAVSGGIYNASLFTAGFSYTNHILGSIVASVLPAWEINIGDFNFSISPSIAIGKGWGFGANVSVTFHAGDFAISGGFGIMHYGSHPGSGEKGWEYRKSAMLTYDDGKFGVSLGTNIWSGLHEQQTGIIGLRHGDFSMSYENDGSPFDKVKRGLLGDGHDRWRTAAMRFEIGDFSMGFNLFTGERTLDSYYEQKGADYDTMIQMRMGQILGHGDAHGGYGASLRYGLVEEKGNRYRLGAAYIGWGNYRIGIDSDRHVRHPIQNILAHTWLSPQPGFEVLSGGIKPFFQYQTRNKFTSW